MQWLKKFLNPSQENHFFSLEKECFRAEYLQSLAQNLLETPYLADNVLNQRFATTQGFSIIFRPQHLPKVLLEFPLLETYLAHIMRPEYNLYYLNALSLRENSLVERHIDHSIRGYGIDLPYPKQVSVLYVVIPKMEGGDLQLYDPQENPLALITPQTGLKVNFRGDLKHTILPVKRLAESHQPRLSLVCEQYHLSPQDLERVPEFTLKSTVDFKTFLDSEVS
ncbi:iron-regulated protein [bacterium (Candidatus Blackallbacteria) CG17_big_fil_post_rev_8_21_14_2_50_48_46]|uniref:Iron-regulated protein n=1 Tax=bacterium (Candidatus Blackallbacteria) CG17_big_fil_post_rev_8_21_14_2_50_48_46 TaxID=2014261 RepID=A0A2M7G8G1_9BACT|nr:MAG: iron-regulated protein [bacterium (Candidatus Blackallbacteria) CG18_big_fil_WC_8_21_14_2_50_49_26]PIW18392.1 MAG: iron-regulated protein [bacterium (Candidatus Blackallbacteria) CG17_big_fil_post_rev_8_21_14_2_50_48_46]PIW50551.1 MAG: iron-regulated protein [bacterium (Candidatus Blackallbacteria) CG13_big_fil_rev_8_21_14_2_50_49_14]